jgi:hypothetical protein
LSRIFLSRAKTRITEQSNVLLILVVVQTFASVYGWIEGEIYPYYPYSGRLELFGHFTYYHLAMVMLFALAGFSIAVSRVMASYKKGYFILASFGSVTWGFWIEDMAYFAQRYPADTLGPASWVNWILSGHYLLGHWIPTIYYVMALAGFMLYAAAFVRSRKDSITVMTRPMLTGRAHPSSPFRSLSRLGETVGYLRSILPVAIVIVPVAIVASASKDWTALPCSLGRIAAVWLIAFIPSIALFFASNRRYLNSFLEDQFKPLVFGS